MSKVPYRPGPRLSEADDELARLAAEGEHRILGAKAAGAARADRAAHREERRKDENVRIALGAYYGSPLRKACVALMGAGVLTFVVGGRLRLEGAAAAVALAVGLLALIGGFLAAFWVDGTATRARAAAERTWAESLPFVVEGYFELLAQDPVIACRLLVELAWEPGGAPAPEIVRGALGMWDAGAGVEVGEAGSMTVRSGPFKCGYYRRSSGELHTDPLPNRHLVRRVHTLVNNALLPLHRSRALTRIALSREVVYARPGERSTNA